jgi:hypothetical protein
MTDYPGIKPARPPSDRPPPSAKPIQVAHLQYNLDYELSAGLQCWKSAVVGTPMLYLKHGRWTALWNDSASFETPVGALRHIYAARLKALIERHEEERSALEVFNPGRGR